MPSPKNDFSCCKPGAFTIKHLTGAFNTPFLNLEQSDINCVSSGLVVPITPNWLF